MQNNIIKRFDTTYIYFTIAMLLTAFLRMPVITYIIVFAICILLAGIADKFSKKPFIIPIFLCLFIIVVTLFVGLRDFGIGTDTNVYIDSYFQLINYIHNYHDLFLYGEGYNWGFLFLAWIAHLFSNSSQSLLLITELFVLLFTIYGFQILNKQQRVSYSAFIFLYLFSFINSSMNYMRQFCAMAILFTAFAYLMNGKWKQYIILQIISLFFHGSAIIFGFVPFFYYLSTWKDTKKRYIILISIIILTSIIAISLPEYLKVFWKYGLISQVYADRYGVNTDYSGNNLFGMSAITIYILVYIAIYISHKKEIITNNEAFLAYTFHSLFIAIRLSSLAIVYLSRLSDYYYHIDIWFLALMISSKKFPTFLKVLICICILYYWYRAYVIGGDCETLPYSSHILGI